MALLNGLLDRLLANKQDALLLSPGRPPRYRSEGAETDAAAFELDGTIISELLEEASPDHLVVDAPVGSRHDFVRRHQGIDLAFGATATADGWSVAVRPVLPSPSRSLPESPADSPSSDSVTPDSPALVPGPPASPRPSTPTASGVPILESTSSETAGSATSATSSTNPATGPRSVLAAAPASPRPDPVAACSPAVVYPGDSSGGRGLPAIEVLLTVMQQRGASDLHLSAGQAPRLRLDGELHKVDEWGTADSVELTNLLARLMPPRNRDQFDETNDTDFAHEIDGVGRFRINVFRERHGVGVVFRHIPFEPPSFEELGLPSVLQDLTKLSKGLVLVTGPTGSGKSTTLAAMIHLLNRSRRDHIITIEDPIEFVHESDRCMVTQREVGPHTGSFHHALRAALREDPDVVLVGEMRDLETMSTAIHTAETGHLVFGTLHTTSAPSTVERVIGQFPGDLQGQIRLMLAESLRAVISQTLLRKIGGGRVAAFEILLGTPAVSNLIREGKTFQIASSMQTGKRIGMRTLTDSLFALVTEGLVEPDEAYSKAVFKEALAGKFDAAGIRLEETAKSELVA